MARALRPVQGLFEEEICCEGEADLHRHFNQCKKNPGHKQFIPVNEFAVNHLPPRYHDDGIVNLVKALSDITVRISVRHTSKNRPDAWPGPSYDLRGRNNLRTGSGWVWRVNVYHYLNYNKKTCPCRSCRGSRRPETQWAVIDIYTATHLVYDELEGAHTTCHFFYDDKNSSLGDLPSLSEATRVENDYDSDTCRLTYITHNIHLGSKLVNMGRLYKTLHLQVGEKYNTDDKDGQMKADNDHTLTIIVSHPHGYSKMISVGEFTKRDEMEYNDVYTKYTYTTATCTGCSGAPVYVLSRWWWWGCDHPHSGQCKDNPALNYSGVAMY